MTCCNVILNSLDFPHHLLNHVTITKIQLYIILVVCISVSSVPFIYPLVVKAFQEYSEPEDANSSSPQRRAPTAGEDEAVALPLGENTLTHNLGIPVLVVCTKVSNYPCTMLSISYCIFFNQCSRCTLLRRYKTLPFCLPVWHIGLKIGQKNVL